MLQSYDPRNQNLLVNIDGQLVHRDQAGVSPFDSSVQNGDAVWEGLRVYEGRIFKLDEHIDRLFRSATMLRYEGVPTKQHIIREMQRTLDANGMHDGVHIRLILSRGLKYTSGLDPRVNAHGCSLFVLAEFKPPVFHRQGITLITATVRRPPKCVLDQHIHSSNQLTSILAKMQANDAGADDAILLDTRGFLAETSATHLFLAFDREVHTPTTEACPEGITRRAVLEICREQGIEALERDIEPTEVFDADEMFCTGTMGELVPIVSVDGRKIGTNIPGPMTQQLTECFTELTRQQGTQVVASSELP